MREVTSVQRSRADVRAMMKGYADHWGIDPADVPPEQWSDIASAPDPLTVVPDIEGVEGVTPAQPLPQNEGFTPVPAPPFEEAFPAGDGLDFPTHTGGAAPVIEGLDILSTPIPDMAQATILENRRYEPGVVTGQGQPVGADWMRRGVVNGGAPIPEQIADKLRDRAFATFDDSREAFWEEVAADRALAGQFAPQNRGLINRGYAPVAPPAEQVGDRRVFELDHIDPIFRGGEVYDVDNLQVMTPRAHIEKTRND